MRQAACRSCGAPIVWARTDLGRTFPVDAGKVANGNVTLRVVHDVVHATIGKPGSGEYVSHFSSCPNANQHRQAKGARA